MYNHADPAVNVAIDTKSLKQLRQLTNYHLICLCYFINQLLVYKFAI